MKVWNLIALFACFCMFVGFYATVVFNVELSSKGLKRGPKNLDAKNRDFFLFSAFWLSLNSMTTIWAIIVFGTSRFNSIADLIWQLFEGDESE